MTATTKEIQKMTVPWLFEDLRRGKKSGTAVFERDGTVKKVFFKQGEVLFASSNGAEDQLGEFLMRSGKITRAQFDKSSEAVIKGGKKLGAVLFEMGALTASDLVEQVKLQVREIIVGLFRWRTGGYRFESESLHPSEIIPLHMSTGDLILQGLHSLDEEAIRASLPPETTVLRPVADVTLLFQRAQLDEGQRQVMAFIDGSRTIAEIRCLSERGDAETLKALYLLLALRMAEAGEIKAPEEKEFLCEVVREAFASGSRKQPIAAAPSERTVAREMIQSAYDALALHNHYDVLGVGHGAQLQEIKKAYFVLSKLYHPDRHFEPEMGDMKEKLEALFARIHDAYETLSSPAARQQYNIDLASGALQGRTPDKEGAATQRERAAAAARFDEGMKEFRKNNFWGADEAFQAAMRLDPANAEYVYYRGLCLSRMPRRGHESEEYFIKAIEMAPDSTEYYVALGQFYSRTGQKAKALSLYQDALQHDANAETINQEIKKAGA